MLLWLKKSETELDENEQSWCVPAKVTPRCEQ